MVRRWIGEARREPKTNPEFVAVKMPAAPSPPGNQSLPDKRSTIRIEIPRTGGAVEVEWPAEHAHQCAALLRDLLG